MVSIGIHGDLMEVSSGERTSRRTATKESAGFGVLVKCGESIVKGLDLIQQGEEGFMIHFCVIVALARNIYHKGNEFSHLVIIRKEIGFGVERGVNNATAEILHDFVLPFFMSYRHYHYNR